MHGEMARKFIDIYRDRVSKVPWPEGAIYEDLDYEEAIRYAEEEIPKAIEELRALLPQHCGKCRFCGDRAIEAGDACPTCGRRHDDPSA